MKISIFLEQICMAAGKQKVRRKKEFAAKRDNPSHSNKILRMMLWLTQYLGKTCGDCPCLQQSFEVWQI
jgi:hypothetical protein